LNVATFIIGKAIQGVSAAYLTRIAGKSFIEYFSQNQDWGDGGITEVVQKQFQLIKKDKFVKLFLEDAIAKFVEPLTNIYSSDKKVETESEAEINYQSQSDQKVYDYDDWKAESRAKREDW
ncbi:MAG: YcjF family protein, partial [Trichodesmium sp. MAG_R04]|nr:YcjF family protein [Trichodesmium sp. MAG_R04]